LASCPPFLEKDREELLEWTRQHEDVTVTKIGESVLGRAVHAISVGGPKDEPAPHGVAITCGQHSPLEIMGGRVLRPVIENLLNRPELLAECNFHFVPTVNVDCQHFGGNGLNANRRNNNRHWMVNIQPENRACVDYFDSLKEAGQRIDFAMDIHAGGIFRNHVLMHMAQSDTVSLSHEALAAQEQWRDLLEKHAGLRRDDCSSLPQLNLRATDYFHQVHGATAFCLELSTCSFYDPQIRRTRPFGQEAIGILADGLVQAWAEKFLHN
ncbi:MAG: M14 family zinc carboxypeptidase, partial [Armatimonadota bacterium]